ncbi:MAG: gamma-glutamylcyclotransferase family protein [Christiangramia sp.]|nr:gamma-glutamylcyclotransferase family protein [Christiangramia sp.]
MDYLFAYGTLQDEKIQQSIFGRTINGKPDLLSGYEKYSIRIPDNSSGTYYPAIKPSDGQKISVPGTLLQLRGNELLMADTYEGDSYIRKKLKLESGIIAWVYIAKY